jgi:hypothetical protein
MINEIIIKIYDNFLIRQMIKCFTKYSKQLKSEGNKYVMCLLSTCSLSPWSFKANPVARANKARVMVGWRWEEDKHLRTRSSTMWTWGTGTRSGGRTSTTRALCSSPPNSVHKKVPVLVLLHPSVEFLYNSAQPLTCGSSPMCQRACSTIEGPRPGGPAI